MFDVLRFLKDHHVDFITEGNKHCRPGWVQVHCPFCNGSQNYHLGINLDQGYGHCWRCRGKSLWTLVKGLTRENNSRIYQIIEHYSNGRPVLERKAEIKVDIRKNVKLPMGSSEMTERHRKYLIKRNFDPDLLEHEWELLGTGPIGEYRHRIIAPIYYHRKLVSFQGRDITNKSELRYKACSIDKEVIHHKHILYGLDKVRGDELILVEGITDVWRFGTGAVATFGTGFTRQQAQILSRFRRCHILFDPEPVAQKTAEELAWHLQMLGVDAPLVWLAEGEDPGSLSQKEADYIKKQLLKPYI